MAANTQPQRANLVPTLAAVYVAAVGFNYVWEIAQSPLYVGMGDFSTVWWHCGLAALGDGWLVLLIFGAGGLICGGPQWFRQPGARGYGLMWGAGLLLSVGLERFAVGNKLWAYQPFMPLVPLLCVGLAPVAQMLLLPPLVFRTVAAWQDRQPAKEPGGNP